MSKSELPKRPQFTRSRFERIFWIDASNKVTIEQSYKNIVAEEQITSISEHESPVQSVLRWLSNLKQEWLLLLDNADDPEVLRDLLLNKNIGNILYTSRKRALLLNVLANAVCDIEEMQESEAVTLLLKAARLDEESEEMRRLAMPIVKELGCLALAIDQAGAYIAMGRCNIEGYVEMFRNHREELLKNPEYKGASRYNQVVYAAYEISYKAMENLAQEGAKNSQASQAAEIALQILNLCIFSQ